MTTRPPKTRKIALTVRLGEADFQMLQRLAKSENRSPTNYVETALLQNIAARAEGAGGDHNVCAGGCCIAHPRARLFAQTVNPTHVTHNALR